MKWCWVLLVAVVCGAQADCDHHYFQSLNVTSEYGDGTGELCRGHCCGRRREEQLRILIRRRMVTKSVTSLTSVADLIDNTRNTLQEHLTALSRQSQNTTSQFFSRVYQTHALRTRDSISAFYDDIRSLLFIQPDNFGSPPPKNLAESANTFFRNIFPVAYHKVLNLDGKQLTAAYELCLKDAYSVVQPFGDIPQQLGSELSKSFEAARVLLQALLFGTSVLNASAQVLSSASHEQCSSSLVRAAACAKCQGLDAKPCNHYCLNVVRGCLGSLVSELDAPWNSYVNGVERLAKGTIDGSIPTLDTRISDAVMHAFTSNDTLEKKVRDECGPPTTLEVPFSSAYTLQPLRRDAASAPPPDTELVQFLAVLTTKDRLFSGLFDRLCDELAHRHNNNCWTGDHVGEYTKALVRSASAVDQMYNPEVLGISHDQNTVSNITTLANKLKHARQLLEWQWSNPESPAEPDMLGDEAGSGSSVYDGDDDDDDDQYHGSGEGSGHYGRTGAGIYTDDKYPEVVTVQKTAAASIASPRALYTLALTCCLTRMLT